MNEPLIKTVFLILSAILLILSLIWAWPKNDHKGWNTKVDTIGEKGP